MKKIFCAFTLSALLSLPGLCEYTFAPSEFQPVNVSESKQISLDVEKVSPVVENTSAGTVFRKIDNEQPKKNTVRIIITKDTLKKYRHITTDTKIIEAVELLRNSVGDFSYKSIFGNNFTGNPIRISFAGISSKKESKNITGKLKRGTYHIYIDSKNSDAPAGVLAAFIAREALITDSEQKPDSESLDKIQNSVWKQMCERNPELLHSEHQLAKTAEKLLIALPETDYDSTATSETTAPPYAENNKLPNTRNGFLPKFGKKPSGKATQTDFDVFEQEKAEKVDSEVETISFDSKTLRKKYKKVTSEDRIIEALELLTSTVGKFSHNAVLGSNITHKPMAIQFKNLGEISTKYENFDALGWSRRGRLFIYINQKHSDAPAAALAALISHEALHQDEFDSLNEETYAWTMEAAVWTQLCEAQPQVDKINHPLVTRENLLKKLFEKGDYTSKFIKKSVFSNPSYKNLPSRSPGFEDD